MPKNDKIRTIVVSVHLGAAPAFEIRADEDATATPVDCKFSGQGAGPADKDFLSQLLEKLMAAYGASPAITLCLQGQRIKRDTECL
jgi:hypothetical protein